MTFANSIYANLSYFLLTLSYGLCASFVLLKYNFYLFLVGVPSFSRGGIAQTKHCFDLLSCSLALCQINNTFYTPEDSNCDSSQAAFLNRTPAWQQGIYQDFDSDFLRLLALLSVNSGLPLVLPMFTTILGWCLESGVLKQKLKKVFCFILIVLSVSSFVVLQSQLWTFDSYKPTLPEWLDNQIVIITRVIIAILLVQTLSACLILLLVQFTEIDSSVAEFETLTLKQGQATVYTPDDESEDDD